MPSNSLELRNSLGYVVAQLARRLTGELAGRLAPHGLTPPRWAVLAALWEREGQSQAELTRLLGTDGATLNGVLDRLGKQGLVRRERDPRDGRLQRVYLTGPAHGLEADLPPLAQAVNERALAGFSSAERELLLDLLRRALANLESTGDA